MSMERNRNSTRTCSLGGGNDLLSSPDDAGGLVTITHVPHEERVAASGMTVGQVRTRYRDRFDVDPRSQAFIDGVAVGDDTVLRSGQNLMFMRHSGEKGSGSTPPPGALGGAASPESSPDTPPRAPATRPATHLRWVPRVPRGGYPRRVVRRSPGAMGCGRSPQ